MSIGPGRRSLLGLAQHDLLRIRARSGRLDGLGGDATPGQVHLGAGERVPERDAGVLVRVPRVLLPRVG